VTHVPELAAEGAPPRRSLVLAGGGMRVAWQAGVLRALAEDGIRFAHGDGASGGTINLAMLLSGLTAEEMCDRWATLDVKDFVSLLPLRRYLRGPAQLGYGDADGLVRKVFPHLGIDVERIRAARGLDGTFNVVEYGSKTNHAIPHTEIDLDLLVAGVSLPIMMPPVPARGGLWTDSVWIKDANVLEAAARGAEEIWLLWCIGNTGVYRKGVLNQYVHMIELSANGSLGEELAQLARLPRPPVLHVVKPEYPIPLDPDFYRGRISARALVAMGYRDARRVLADRAPAPLDAAATRMRDPGRAVAFTESWRGASVRAELRVEIPDLDAFDGTAAVSGWVRTPAGAVPVASGTFRAGAGHELAFRGGGLTLADGRAALRVDGETREEPVRRTRGPLRGVHATSADRLSERIGTTVRFARLARRF
jgi:predicted acylesterase/phospholipase RssA